MPSKMTPRFTFAFDDDDKSAARPLIDAMLMAAVTGLRAGQALHFQQLTCGERVMIAVTLRRGTMRAHGVDAANEPRK